MSPAPPHRASGGAAAESSVVPTLILTLRPLLRPFRSAAETLPLRPRLSDRNSEVGLPLLPPPMEPLRWTDRDRALEKDRERGRERPRDSERERDCDRDRLSPPFLSAEAGGDALVPFLRVGDRPLWLRLGLLWGVCGIAAAAAASAFWSSLCSFSCCFS